MENTNEQVLAVVDWFRFTCLWGAYNPFDGDADSNRLFSLLRLNRDEFRPHNTNLASVGYPDGYLYDERINVGISPRPNVLVHGISDQFMVDMPAAACHQFEDRGGNWLDLLRFLASHAVRFNRIDIAVDDINGVLDVSKVRRKVASHEFVCPYRSKVKGGPRGSQMYNVPPLDPLCSVPYVWDKGDGYSATFGARGSSQQLQIYDKSAERQAHNVGVTCNSWIRFEARFCQRRAGCVVRDYVIPSLEKGEFGLMADGLIRGLLEFKEGKITGNDLANRNFNKYPIWRDYSRFLHGADAIKVPSCQNKVEASVTRTVEWGKKSWKKSLIRMFGCGMDPLKEVMAGVVDSINKEGLSWEMIAQVKNYFRDAHKDHVPTTDEVLDNLQQWVDFFCPDDHVDIWAKFGEMKDRLSKSRSSDSTKFMADLFTGDGNDGVDDGSIDTDGLGDGGQETDGGDGNAGI